MAWLNLELRCAIIYEASFGLCCIFFPLPVLTVAQYGCACFGKSNFFLVLFLCLPFPSACLTCLVVVHYGWHIRTHVPFTCTAILLRTWWCGWRHWRQHLLVVSSRVVSMPCACFQGVSARVLILHGHAYILLSWLLVTPQFVNALSEEGCDLLFYFLRFIKMCAYHKNRCNSQICICSGKQMWQNHTMSISLWVLVVQKQDEAMS